MSAWPRLRLRARVSAALEASGLASRLLGARARAGSPWLTVLTWHRVRPSGDAGDFDEGVVDATASEFDRQLEILRRHFTFVGLDDVRRWTRGGALPKNPVLLTFDDAYRDCVDHALPILRRHGARAAFFVSTRHVEERRVFWWDRASHLLRRAKVPRAEIPAFGLALELGNEAQRAASLRRVLRTIKDRHGLPIDELLDAIGEACGVEWSREKERAIADELIATWSDVRALRDAGMDVQSHTRTHRVLQTLSTRELESELAGAREDLESVLREKVFALAYPTGRPVDPRSEIARAVRAAGYDVAFENDGGVNPRVFRPSPLKLRRVPMERGTSAARFESILVLPHLV